jgi:uncharacterized protein YyaL (SSP411 family)
LPFLDRIVLHARDPASLPTTHPAQEKIKMAGSAAAFVCVGDTCSLPVARPDELNAVIATMHSSAQ